jgi:hypothetical protein
VRNREASDDELEEIFSGGKLMHPLSAYDLRQFNLIKKKIELFENNRLDLFYLVNELGAFLNILESVPDAWEDDFRAQTNALELIHDSIEDGSIIKWNGNFKEDVYKSISKLKKMITFMIEEYLKTSDSNILESAVEADSNWLICPKCNDAWESDSRYVMVICPKCESAFHNPRTSMV